MTVAKRAYSTLIGTIAQVRAALAQTSPVTCAVAVTSLLAATLFVVVDAARSFEDADMRRGLISLTARARVAEGLSSPFVAAAALTKVPVGRSVSPPPAAEDATLTTLTSVAQRGAGAYGLALLVIGASWRRRPSRPKFDDGDGLSPYHELVAGMPIGVACWAVSGELQSSNAQFRALLEDADAGVGVGGSYRQALKQLVGGGTARLKREDDQSRLLELNRIDGSTLLVEDRALEAGGFVTMVTDVTAQRRADMLLSAAREEQRLLTTRYHEEKLRAEAASHSKTAFLAHLSHDIRTPLNHIIGFAELIRHQTYGPIGDPRYLNYVETIKGSGERLLGFFAAMLELAELESGKRGLREEALQVDDLLNTIAQRFGSQAQRAGLILSVGPRCGTEMTGDRFCLERMLANLVENALRFTPTGGKVTLAAYAAADGVVIEVTDTGIGIAEERLADLAQPFAYGDATLTRETGGSSLGLPISRAIAEQSGGRLCIDSRQGLGTTVAISLPLRAIEASVGVAA